MRSFAPSFPLPVLRQRYTLSKSNNKNSLQVIGLSAGTAICLPNPKGGALKEKPKVKFRGPLWLTKL